MELSSVGFSGRTSFGGQIRSRNYELEQSNDDEFARNPCNSSPVDVDCP